MREIKIPKGWNTKKENIKGDMKRAIEYRDYHRCIDILDGNILFNPKLHKTEIFALNGVK